MLSICLLVQSFPCETVGPVLAGKLADIDELRAAVVLLLPVLGDVCWLFLFFAFFFFT